MGRWLLAVPRALRADLWTLAGDPLPRAARPRRLPWLPQALVVALATLAFLLSTNFVYERQVDSVTILLELVEYSAVVLAIFRPVPAWWAATLTVVLGAGVGGSRFPWSPFVILPLTAVLFLLAVRVRPRATAEAWTLTVLAILSCTGFHLRHYPDYGWGGLILGTDYGQAVLLLSIAAGFGARRRSRRAAAARRVAQKTLAARDQARRTVLQERGRIARELHDVVAHHLSVISIQAQVAPHLVADPPKDLTENLTGIRQNALDALTELRRVLGVLRLEDEDPQHAPQPTLERLDELIGNVRAAGVTVTVETSGRRRPLSPGVELSAFRLVQEALSNAIRHAPGATVRVAITYGPASVTVRISNSAPGKPVQPTDALLSPNLTKRLIVEFSRTSGAPRAALKGRVGDLTERETEVLSLIAQGLSNMEIGAHLFVVEHTVKTHVGRILTKLGLRDRTQAAVFAYESGLVRPAGY